MLWNTKWFPGTNLQDLNLDWILKKIAALRGGTAGQYLYKKSNKDFDFGWKTGSGGGGGTSDYLELDNKPSINNVELTGNKTASDLGLALSTDIPVVPVQSVNGKTGAVVLSASDVGAYVKPASGIPKTDLSSAVQTSLDKADSALQDVPSTYRTAAAQDAIDEAQDSNLATIETSPVTQKQLYYKGDYLVYNGQLYKVTAATISAGQTLTPGTNIAALSVGQFMHSNEIKTQSVTGTTNSAGNLGINLASSSIFISAAEPTGVGHVLQYFRSNGISYLKTIDWTTMQIVPNTEITVDVTYI